MPPKTEEDDSSVEAVAVKLPAFWAQNPVAWFQRAEGQFRIKKITCQLTKFDYVLQALPEALVPTARSQCENPREDSAYDDLKKALLERHAPNRFMSMTEFIESTPIGPGQDPELIADIIDGFKLEDKETEFAFFVSKMPPAVKVDLVQDYEVFKNLRAMAKVAKRIMVKAQSVSEVVSPVNQTGRKRGDGKPSSSQRGRLCYSHYRFGEKAQNCRGNCAWRGGATRRQFAITMESENEQPPC